MYSPIGRDTLLFNDTIFYNIAYGNLSADQGAVQAAAMYVARCCVFLSVCVSLLNPRHIRGFCVFLSVCQLALVASASLLCVYGV